jgi:hypothetical protein
MVALILYSLLHCCLWGWRRGVGPPSCGDATCECALPAAQLRDEHVKDDLDVLIELQYSTAACIRICRFNVRLDFLSASTVRCQVPQPTALCAALLIPIGLQAWRGHARARARLWPPWRLSPSSTPHARVPATTALPPIQEKNEAVAAGSERTCMAVGALMISGRRWGLQAFFSSWFERGFHGGFGGGGGWQDLGFSRCCLRGAAVDMALVRLPPAASARGGPSPPAAGRRARVLEEEARPHGFRLGSDADFFSYGPTGLFWRTKQSINFFWLPWFFNHHVLKPYY